MSTKNRRITRQIRLETDLYEELKILAEVKNTTLSKVLGGMVRKNLEERKRLETKTYAHHRKTQ